MTITAKMKKILISYLLVVALISFIAIVQAFFLLNNPGPGIFGVIAMSAALVAFLIGFIMFMRSRLRTMFGLNYALVSFWTTNTKWVRAVFITLWLTGILVGLIGMATGKNHLEHANGQYYVLQGSKQFISQHEYLIASASPAKTLAGGALAFDGFAAMLMLSVPVRQRFTTQSKEA